MLDHVLSKTADRVLAARQIREMRQRGLVVGVGVERKNERRWTILRRGRPAARLVMPLSASGVWLHTAACRILLSDETPILWS